MLCLFLWLWSVGVDEVILFLYSVLPIWRQGAWRQRKRPSCCNSGGCGRLAVGFNFLMFSMASEHGIDGVCLLLDASRCKLDDCFCLLICNGSLMNTMILLDDLMSLRRLFATCSRPVDTCWIYWGFALLGAAAVSLLSSYCFSMVCCL